MSKLRFQIGDSFARFGATAWTQIRQLKAAPVEQRVGAGGLILARYWKPLYAFFRAKGCTSADAENLVGEFVFDFLVKGKFEAVDGERGRFRTFLMVCAGNFFLDHVRRKENRVGRKLISFEKLKRLDGPAFEPVAADNPDRAFRDTWRRDILAKALTSVQQACEKAGRSREYEVFAAYYLCEEADRPTWQALAQRFAIEPNGGVEPWKRASRMAEWLKTQLRNAIRHIISSYVEDDDEIDDEIRDLLG